ncbi:MAG: PDZ domain-containing protein [Streptosporangiaceae bacterium]|nr:PDZ domain-containing protein [Streptosporangiaceae bacterium]
MSRVASAGYLRYPHIHGDLVTFVAEDDVWLAPAGGGRAWRLSSDGVQVSYPRFSRDGEKIAWTSWRDGCPEVYAADTAGSEAARLTYWGDPRTRVTGWTRQGEVLAVSAAGQPASVLNWAYAVPLDAPPRRLPFGPVADLALEPSATALLTGRTNVEPAYWKRYRGGTAGRLWTATAEDPLFSRVLSGLEGQFASPMLVGGRLVFLSDHEGTGNLYSCALDGTGLRRHTGHDGGYVRNAATDGQRIVYHVTGDIWILDTLDAEPRRLELSPGSPAAAHAPRLISAADHLGDLDCDETGQASVVEVRGTVHWLTHRDGPARALSVDPGGRARLPRVLGDTGKAVWVTDAGGADALEVAPVGGEADGEQTPRPVRLAENQLGTVTDLAASPDGAAVAAAAHDGRVLVVDVASGRVTELAAGDDGEASGLSWSPDSAWLAWSQPGPRPLSRIRMARIADRLVADVTDGRFADSEPVFTADGLYLAFLSRRSFDPVYDAHSFDLSFPNGSRPYLVSLGEETPSPFGPLPGGRPVSQENSKDSPERAVVTVDADGLPARVVSVPVDEARYSGLAAVKGGLTWLRSAVSGVLGEGAADVDADRPRPCLERFDLRKREATVLVGELDWYAVSGDGTRLAVRDHDELRVVPSERKADSNGSDDAVDVDLSRARFRADPATLWRHAYDEAGRLMRRDFWVPDMSGIDWDGVLDAYRPLLDRVRGAGDFADLLWEVFGELGTSHAYVAGAPPERPRDGMPAVGLLGADLSRDGSGRWVVDRVLPGESSDPYARSPLEAPGAAARPGDELVAVDGQAVDPVRGPWPLLAGTAGKPVELTIRRQAPPVPGTSVPGTSVPGTPAPGTPAPGTPQQAPSLQQSQAPHQLRRVVVVPLRDERRLRYQDWVAGRRRIVHEAGEGKLGYLHVPDMTGEGWAHLHRDLRSEMSRDALIVDVRGNRGGHTSQLIVEKLARRVIGWDVGRWLRPVTYPHDAPRGPVVALADEFAGSDGDIVTAAIRALEIGPVVGARTWGGVIGIDGMPGHLLVDGTHITVPRYAFWFSEFGWSVENYGVDPDIEVLITPDDWVAGRDPQLETAVRMALDALAKRPAVAPPDQATAPTKTRPPLPPHPTP